MFNEHNFFSTSVAVEFLNSTTFSSQYTYFILLLFSCVPLQLLLKDYTPCDPTRTMTRFSTRRSENRRSLRSGERDAKESGINRLDITIDQGDELDFAPIDYQYICIYAVAQADPQHSDTMLDSQLCGITESHPPFMKY